MILLTYRMYPNQDLYAPAIMTNAEWHGRLDSRVQKLMMALRDGLAASLKGGDVSKDGASKNERDAHSIFTPNEEIDYWGYQAAALKGDQQHRAKRWNGVGILISFSSFTSVCLCVCLSVSFSLRTSLPLTMFCSFSYN